jgi:hypothetical protein
MSLALTVSDWLPEGFQSCVSAEYKTISSCGRRKMIHAPFFAIDDAKEADMPEFFAGMLISTGMFIDWPMDIIVNGFWKYPKAYKLISAADHLKIICEMKRRWQLGLDDLGAFLAFFQGAIRQCPEKVPLEHIADVLQEGLIWTPVSTPPVLSEEFRSQIFDIVLAIVITSPLIAYQFHFWVKTFYNVLETSLKAELGSGVQTGPESGLDNSPPYGHRLYAMKIFRILTPGILSECLPENGLSTISESFVQMDLCKNDEFDGLVASILFIWKANPICDITRLIQYIERSEPRDSLNMILDFYYSDCDAMRSDGI